MNTQLTNEDRIRILRELQGVRCFCGTKKPMMKVFCQKHYASLPGRMRSMLYQRPGQGYEEAYMAAREYFEKAEKEATQ